MQCTNLGGMEQVAYALMENLSRESGWQFSVTTPRPFGPGEERIRAVDPAARDDTYRGKLGWRSHGGFKRIVHEKSEGCEAAWITGTGASAVAATRQLDMPRVLSHHFHHFERPVLSALAWRGFYEALGRGLDAITYATDFTRSEALSLCPWLKRKTHVVRNGFPCHYTGEDQRLDKRARARARLGIPEDAFVVGNAGWLIPRKRFDVFVETAARIRGKLPNAFFLICGGGSEEDALRGQVRRLGIDEHVRFTGWVKDLVPYYQAWDVCLFNSDFDNIPCAPLEAASHGCVTVASLKYGGLGEFVINGETGVFMTGHDVPALADAVATLAREPEQARELRENAAAKLRAEFSMRAAMDAYETLLRGRA